MTSPRLDPKDAREQLGRQLRALREATGLKLVPAAARIGRDNSWLSKVERGYTRIVPGEVELLAKHYKVTPETLSALLDLASQAGPRRQSGLYRDLADAVDAGFDALLRIERAATSLRVFENSVFWALSQTEAYAREVLRPGALVDSEAELDARTALRVRRAEILTGPDAPAVTCVMTEGAVRQLVGGAEVMGAQLRHAIALVEDGRLEVRIVPFDAGSHAATNGAFLLAELPPPPMFPADGPEVVAYQDTVLGCVYHRDRAQVEVFETIWANLDETALSAEKSVATLRRMADDLTRPTSTT